MSDRSLAEQFLDELPRYEHLGDVVKVRLEAALRAAGVKVESVVSRTKDLDSFLKKTIRKTYDDPMSQITDKVGVRVIVSRQVDVPAVDAVVASSFDVREREDKADNLAEDQLGYLGLHFLVAGDDSFPTDQFDLVGRICEIQIHTQVQNAWATVSHPLVYKGRQTGGASRVRRRVNRLTALVELFDQEVETARSQLMSDQDVPEVFMLDVVEPPFVRLVGRPYDELLSLRLLHVLSAAYTPDELAEFPGLIDSFVEAHGQEYAELVARGTEGAASDPLLSQPESLVVYERLHNARMALRATWDEEVDPILLTRLSESLGRPLQPA